jgi:hypothetical protein
MMMGFALSDSIEAKSEALGATSVKEPTASYFGS